MSSQGGRRVRVGGANACAFPVDDDRAVVREQHVSRMQVAVDERLSFSDLGWNVDTANGYGGELTMQLRKHASNGSCLPWTFRQKCQ